MFSVLTHFLVPGYSNNQKAKVLHSLSILFFISGMVAYQFVLQSLPLSGVRILGYASNISVNEIVALSNQKRLENGLPTLRQNSLLDQAAHAKGQDMLSKNYWAHVSPDGTQPWYFITNAGYTYKNAGENLARDFTNANSAIEAWMASPSHRDNLLSGKYQEIGVAVVEGDLDGVDTTIIVQLFGTKYSQRTPTTVVEAESELESLAVNNITPTLIPTVIPTAQPELTQVVVPAEVVNITPTQGRPLAVSQEAGSSTVLISPFSTTRSMSILIVIFLFGVLVVDGLVIRNRKITRIGGRTFAHLAFLGMVLAIALIARAGEIL